MGYVRNVVMHQPSGVEVSAVDVMKLTDNVRRVVDDIRPNPFLTGRLVSLEETAIGSCKLYHGLGKIPLGWIQVDAYSVSASYVNVVRYSWDSECITVSVDTDGTDASISLWVF